MECKINTSNGLKPSYEFDFLKSVADEYLVQCEALCIYIFEIRPDEIRSRLRVRKDNCCESIPNSHFDVKVDTDTILRSTKERTFFIEDSSEDVFAKHHKGNIVNVYPIKNQSDTIVGCIACLFDNESLALNCDDENLNALRFYFSSMLYYEQSYGLEKLWQELALFAKVGYWYRDMVTDRVSWSKETYEIFGETPYSFHPTVDLYYKYVHKDDLQRMHEAEIESVKSNSKLVIDHRIVTPDNQVRWIHLQGQLRYDSSQQPIEFFGIVQDITENKNREQALEDISLRDVLTGMKNRRGFLNLLDHSIGRHQEFFVTYIDLDYFKEINDLYGHDIGDKVLSAFGERLSKSVKNFEQLGRIGGDEFALITFSQQEHDQNIREMFDILEQPIHIEGLQVNISASMGTAIYPVHAQTASELLSFADDAMFEAKNSGKTRFLMFDTAIADQQERKANIRKRLNKALANHQGLYLTYQRIVVVDSDEDYFECLLRWKDQELGDVFPDEFIPIAEESGYMTRLTLFVIQTAVRDINNHKHLLSENYKFSINLSPSNLHNQGLAFTQLLAFLKFHNSLKGHVCFEITETALVSEQDEIEENLRKISALGFEIALDDFGTGYSSMTHCHRFSLDIIKIDKSFIIDYASNESSKRIVDCILYMALTFDLKVIAEGIETEEVANLLEQRCHALQGFYFSKPERLSTIFSTDSGHLSISS